MIYNFPGMDGRLEDRLDILKEQYQKPKMPQEQVEKLKKRLDEAGIEHIKGRTRARITKYATVAALAAIFVALPNTSDTIANAMSQIPVIGHMVEAVTFRNYEYSTDRNMASIEVPGIKLSEQAVGEKEQETLEHTAKEINAEIQEITDNLIKEFKKNLRHDWGYQDVSVRSEVLATAKDYFTLKLNCYQGAGSGYSWNYYYTVDLNTGERLKLGDIFQEGADYITPISENIKAQMKAQMEADENVTYWLDNEIEEWNFRTISEETSFYLNEKGLVVIGFNEGDVAPMYMGAVEFEIPEGILEGIKK